jgi:hypothetical protein
MAEAWGIAAEHRDAYRRCKMTPGGAMTRTEAVRRLIGAACGAAGAVAFAIGLVLMVLWTFDSTSSSAGSPELIGGGVCLAIGALCVVVRRRFIARRPALSRDGERAT